MARHDRRMSIPFRRRSLLLGTAAAVLGSSLPAFAQEAASGAVVHGAEFGLVPEAVPGEAAAAEDQSARLQEAVDAAAARGLPLFLPGGVYAVSDVHLPSALTIEGVRGATTLLSIGEAPVLWAEQKSAITLRGLGLEGAGTGAAAELAGLLAFTGCEHVELESLRLQGGGASGLYLDRTSGRIEDLVVNGFADNGIFAIDNSGLVITRNRIFDCGNGGIRVWTRESGHDGTIVSGNEIFDIRTDAGGNGENGNGINVFRAHGVTVAGNRLRNCAFSAIRLNATNNTIVSANTCLDSGEVAIFSEFSFAGSVITDNVVDGAAQGISITNFDQNGRLATCTGNIVRNIYPGSRVNPDTTPAGIFAEADTVISGNVVELVPGVGIGAGWGPYLRDVVVDGNVVRDVAIGIGVSVADGAGKAVITDNRVAGARRAGIAGLAWWDTISDDLVRDAAQFPNVSIGGNSVG